ncbi:MAG: zinc-dependent peptidase [Verrucomicrobiaceae bacterium]|nr:zinc-dependent peptidase [Verrucomicrobiaceae bacterium]
MKNIKFSLICLFVIFCVADFSALSQVLVEFKDGNGSWRYEKAIVHGWTVYYGSDIAKDPELKERIKGQLETGIENFLDKLPGEAVDFLRGIPIWVSNEPGYPLRKNERGVIPFHRNKGWLRKHGLNPHMAPGVHVINPQAVLFEHKILEWGPMTLLHELAHAYHNVKLKLSNEVISQAYAKAMARGLYLSVPDRKDKRKRVRAYAATNHEEYFAELTEAYFGKNDWFPHNREELKEYDPRGYSMIKGLWDAKAFR